MMTNNMSKKDDNDFCPDRLGLPPEIIRMILSYLSDVQILLNQPMRVNSQWLKATYESYLRPQCNEDWQKWTNKEIIEKIIQHIQGKNRTKTGVQKIWYNPNLTGVAVIDRLDVDRDSEKLKVYLTAQPYTDKPTPVHENKIHFFKTNGSFFNQKGHLLWEVPSQERFQSLEGVFPLKGFCIVLFFGTKTEREGMFKKIKKKNDDNPGSYCNYYEVSIGSDGKDWSLMLLPTQESKNKEYVVIDLDPRRKESCILQVLEELVKRTQRVGSSHLTQQKEKDDGRRRECLIS